MSNDAPGSVPVAGSATGNNAADPANPAALGTKLASGAVVPPGPATAPKKAVSVADIKAARAALFGASGAKSVAKPGEPALAGQEPSGASGSQNVEGQAKPSELGGSGDGKDPKKEDPAVTQFVGLRRDLETAKQKWKEHEPVIELGKKYQAALKLAESGKQYDAIVAAGFDFDRAAAEVMQIEPDKGTDPVIAELKANQERIEKELKDTRDVEAKAKSDAQKEQGRIGVRAFIVANKDKYPMLARNPAWVDKALASADEAYDKVVAKLDRDLEPAEKNALIETALAQGEKYRMDQRKLYADQEPAPTGIPTTITNDVRGGTNGRPVIGGKMTLEQLRSRNRQRAV